MSAASAWRSVLYRRGFSAELAFCRSIVAQVGVGQGLLLGLSLIGAKGGNIGCAILEGCLPHSVECPCCGWTGIRFRTIFFGSYLRKNCGCPRCQSLERHRAYYLFYLSARLAPSATVLYFAPDRSLYNCLTSRVRNVITADLVAPGVQVRADLMSLPFKTASVDVIIHHHVLEHVPDDAAALGELSRVMKSSGIMFVSVPLNDRLAITEDWGFPDPAKQEHFRDYGADFPERLHGFEHSVTDISATVSPELSKRYGLSQSELLFVCDKSP